MSQNTIGERAGNLAARIDHLVTLRAHVQDVRAFRTRAEQSEALVQLIRPLAEAARILRAHGVFTDDIGDRLPGVRQQIASVRGVFESDRKSFIDPDKSGFAGFDRTVKAFASELEGRLLSAWKEYALVRIPALSAEVLDVVGKIPAYAARVDSIRNLLREVRAATEILPTSEAAFEAFHAALIRLEKAWQELDGGHLSSNVLDFLRAAAGAGADLGALTPEVHGWLEQHGITDSFRIRVVPR